MKTIVKLIYYFQLPIRFKSVKNTEETCGYLYVYPYFQYLCSQQRLVYKRGIKNKILRIKTIRINEYRKRLFDLIKKIKACHENCI